MSMFNQTTGGDIPSLRHHFCSAISASSDDSSFQLTIYGGRQPQFNQSSEDIYVLSIPSFLWVKISDTGNTERKEGAGRSGHTCEIYMGRQMIVLGGDVDIKGSVQNDRGCQVSYPTIRVLDLSNFTWQRQFSPIYDPYMVPDPVVKVIGGKSALLS